MPGPVQPDQTQLPAPSAKPLLGKIVVVDDDPAFARLVQRKLENAHFAVVVLNEAAALQPLLATDSAVDIVITDVLMPQVSGIDLCRQIRERHPAVEVVVMTAAGSIKVAVEAMKAGACDFLTKPLESNEVISLIAMKALERRRLWQRNRYLESQITLRGRFENIIGASPQIEEVCRQIESVAATDTTILIRGESGTGKELVARAIHQRSPRSSRLFLPVNCAALPPALLESELFGHLKGAFTGASGRKRGLFEEADGGTIFLDEVEEMGAAMQAKLLRVLQNREIRPVGSNELRKVNVRVLAASNVDLAALVERGCFRKDVYYRIQGFTIVIPPLRERVEDIPPLAHFFLQRCRKQLHKKIKGMDGAVANALAAHSWPGNVRELEHIIMRAVLLARGSHLTLDTLPPELAELANAPSRLSPHQPPFVTLGYRTAKEQALAAFDRSYLEHLLLRTNGIVAEAARQADMDRNNFRRLLQRCRVEVGRFRRRPS